MNIESVIKKNNNKLYDPYIIAEAGVNHEGSIANAYKLIELAADGGADAIKFQTYRAEKIASKHSQFLAAFPFPPYTISSPGFSATF